MSEVLVQWLGLWASTAEDTGWIPGWGTKILHAARCGKKKKKNEPITFNSGPLWVELCSILVYF